MEKIFAARSFLNYLIRAGNAHSIHSPFLFDFYTNVICDKTPYYAFEVIESVRSAMMLDSGKIHVKDFGAGNTDKKNLQKKVSYIARSSVKNKKYAALLFRIINYMQAKTILEIGTSLGITTLYLSAASPNGKIVSLEGCPETSFIAKQNFEKLKRKNIEVIAGEFTSTLPKALQDFGALDFIFFDGNHRKKPTLDYFKICLEKRTANSVFVFDDIYWSKEMSEAWKEIQGHPAVTISIDLFQLGIIFFDTNLIKQNYVLRF